MIGTDSNGHVGRDPGPGIGIAGVERWTENGLELQRTCTECELSALNTLEDCKHPDWTWQRRDGKGQTRIDYILVSNRLHSQVQSNIGVDKSLQFDQQGHGIDHRPVSCLINFKTLHEQGKAHGSDKPLNVGYSNFNRTLMVAFKAYSTHVDNQFRLVPQPVNPDHLGIARSIQEVFQAEIDEYWNNDDSVDEKNSLLARAACNAFTQFCSKPAERIAKKLTWINEFSTSLTKENLYGNLSNSLRLGFLTGGNTPF